MFTNSFIVSIHTVDGRNPAENAGIKLNTYRPPVLEYKDYCILKLRFLTLRMLVLKNEGAPLPGCHSQVPSSYMRFSGWCNCVTTLWSGYIYLAYLVPGRYA